MKSHFASMDIGCQYNPDGTIEEGKNCQRTDQVCQASSKNRFKRKLLHKIYELLGGVA